MKTMNAVQYTDEFAILVNSVLEYAIFKIDTDGFIQTWNEGAKRIKGYSADEIIGRNISIFYTKADIDSGVVQRNLRRAKENGSFEHESWRVRKDGSVFWANVVFTSIYNEYNQHIGYAKVTRDISDRKQSREDLIRKVEEKTEELRAVFERITDAVVAFDINWNFNYVNKKAAEILGYEPESLIAKNVWEIFPEMKEDGLYNKFITTMESQKTTHMEGYSPRFRLWFAAVLYPSPQGLSVYSQDISYRKEMETLYKETSEKYRQIVETANEGIWMIDTNNKTVFVNQKLCDIMGYSAEEMMGMYLYDFMDDEVKASTSALMELKKTGYRDNIDIKYIGKNGKQIWANISANPLFDESGQYKGALAMVSDITEKVELQKQLLDEQMNRQKDIAKAVLQAEEKERTEIGAELHDNVNQIIAAANLYLNHSLSQTDKSASIIKAMEYICTAIEEIRKLSRNLVGPAKEEKLGLIATISTLIKDITLVKDIDIVFHHLAYDEVKTEPGLKTVIYRIIQEQFNNILKHSKASQVLIEIKNEKDILSLVIADNGKGFNMSERRKGIGLKNISNRVEIYNGTLKISASSGKGCRMEILFKQP